MLPFTFIGVAWGSFIHNACKFFHFRMIALWGIFNQ
jgi:hypothetical protein